ncbi:MAG: alpha/beta hydrolase fold domain-containing protein [Pirellulales bacterium]
MQSKFIALSMLILGLLLVETAFSQSVSVKLISNQVYAVQDGKELKADIYQPQGDGPFPGVLMIHGGAWAGGSRSHMVLHARHLAEHGYCVASISYRLAPLHKYPAQIDDCRLALLWFLKHAKRYKVDPNRIAGYGYSAGAHLACLLATTHNAFQSESGKGVEVQILKAVIAGGTPCNFMLEPEKSLRFAYFLGDSRAKDPKVYEAASPFHHISKNTPPILFFHGTSDLLVPIEGALQMSTNLKKLGIKSEFHRLEKTGHYGAFINQDARQIALRFLDDVMQTKNYPQK